jgi:4-amino-4-deoxy-L-arabinose transferase-like glycosyltransferase
MKPHIQYIVLLCACILLFLLWLPALAVPIFGDTIDYALLGESMWQRWEYTILGESYAKQLPAHAFVSYPFIKVLGYQWGIKVSSLLAGMGVLTVSFLLFKRVFSPLVGLGVALALALHPAFIYMTMVGGADPLFILLFLASVLAFMRANKNQNSYVTSGVMAGLASLTRYNGLPLFLLFLVWGLWKRKTHIKKPQFWVGGFVGIGIFSLWLIRNLITFGDPLYSEYGGEFMTKTSGVVAQFFSNLIYYINPLHNIFPVLLLFALYGLWKFGRSQKFLIFAMLTAWILTSIWWVQAMRFAFPGYPILLGFAFAGMIDMYKQIPYKKIFATLVTSSLLVTHVPAICLYDYGACNALADKTFGFIPANLGVSPEGFYSSALARKYINKNAEANAKVQVADERYVKVWGESAIFRSDFVLESSKNACPIYIMTVWPDDEDSVVFTSDSEPKMSVAVRECP